MATAPTLAQTSQALVNATQNSWTLSAVPKERRAGDRQPLSCKHPCLSRRVSSFGADFDTRSSNRLALRTQRLSRTTPPPGRPRVADSFAKVVSAQSGRPPPPSEQPCCSRARICNAPPRHRAPPTDDSSGRPPRARSPPWRCGASGGWVGGASGPSLREVGHLGVRPEAKRSTCLSKADLLGGAIAELLGSMGDAILFGHPTCSRSPELGVDFQNSRKHSL